MATSRKPKASARNKAVAPLTLDGELTIYRADEVRTLMANYLTEAQRINAPLRVDLAAVNSMDSCGFQLLVALERSAQAAGLAVNWLATSEAVRDVAQVYHYAFSTAQAAAA